jgi:hypothetical protein
MWLFAVLVLLPFVFVLGWNAGVRACMRKLLEMEAPVPTRPGAPPRLRGVRERCPHCGGRLASARPPDSDPGG